MQQAGPPWRRERSTRLRVSLPQPVGPELDYVAEVLASGWWGYGPVCRHLETMVAAWCGQGEALALISCTSALHLALLAAGVGPGDEVILPAITYVATAQAVLQAGAVPVLADVDPLTLGLSPATVAPLIGPRTRAIMPVHLYGIVLDLAPLRTLAAASGLVLVEDAAHALGSLDEAGRPMGRLADLACFSLAPTKPFPSCGGGILLTADPARMPELRSLSCLGLDMDVMTRLADRSGLARSSAGRTGWNYRLNDVAAAIAVAQLERMAELRDERAAQVALYRRLLAGVEAVQLPEVADSARPCWYLLPIRVPAPARDGLRARIAAHGIDTGLHYGDLGQQPLLMDQARACPVAEREAARIVTLPLHAGVADRDIERLAMLVRDHFR